MKVSMVWTGPTKIFPGKGKRVRGDTFMSTRTDAKTFKAIGWATDAPMQPAPETPEAQPPVQTPTPAAAGTRARAPARRAAVRLEGEDDDKPAVRRVYRRRDMTAEE